MKLIQKTILFTGISMSLWFLGTPILLLNHDCFTFQGYCANEIQGINATGFLDAWFYGTGFLSLFSATLFFVVWLLPTTESFSKRLISKEVCQD